MAARATLSHEQRRLLRITGRMPLASVSDLAPVMDVSEERVRRMLRTLKSGGWAESVSRGMTGRPRRRWFLSSRAVDALYVADHRHPGPREEARAAAIARFNPEGRLPAYFTQRFALDHHHHAHLEDQDASPFSGGDGPDHEHPPWTATSRGVEVSLRRLAMLEPFYALAPELLRSGRVTSPSGAGVRMTDFRLLRRGGFYHAVARYGPDLWTPFTYAGLHVTERVLRRKERHRFWGLDSYSHEEGRYLRIGNRLFHEDPDEQVEPSAQVVVASDAWAWELARRMLSVSTPTLFCDTDGRCSPAVELRPSRDLVSDPAGYSPVGRPGAVNLWIRNNPDVAAINGRTAHRLFMAVCQFPAMRASWLVEVLGVSPDAIRRRLRRFVETGLVAVFDGRHYLTELGMRRAANMSRVRASVIRSRHGAYLDRWYREHELHHNDGVNRLVVRFAREGVEAVAGWRGEVNVPALTQVKPDLLLQVSRGSLGSGVHFIEYERWSVNPWSVNRKLGPYRRMAAAGRPLPLLVVCDTARGRLNFRSEARGLPLLTTTLEQALEGPLTGPVTVWSADGVPAALHCGD